MFGYDFRNVEKALLDALKVTFVRHGVPLTMENYCSSVNDSLRQIIFNGLYNNITGSNDAREKLMKYSRDDFSRLVVSEFLKQGGSFEIDDDGNFCLEQSKVLKAIDFYSDVILPKRISKLYFFNDIVIEDAIDKFIKKIKYFKPSNECRKAVFSGEQISVKYSEFKVAGMQAVSSVGKIRDNQEDSYYIGVHPKNSKFKIMIVCDGVGGEANGEKASNLAVREMIEWFESLPEKEFYKNDDDLISSASNKLFDIDKQIRKIDGCPATTICFSIIKNNHVFIGNIGDSMGYVFSNGRLIYSTNSDGYVFADKRIKKLKIIGKNYTSFDRFAMDSNRISLALGRFESDGHLIIDPRDISDKYVSIPMKNNRKYQIVLCSDGVSDCLGTDLLINTVNNSSPDSVSKNLVELALENNPSFEDEYNNFKVKAGVISEYVADELRNIFLEYRFFEGTRKIVGGKDNTTAVSSGIVRRR
jgi:serine/threonine protein phosphatase PrpC